MYYSKRSAARLVLPCLFLTLSAFSMSAQSADKLTVSGGLDYNTGDYGQIQNTNVMSVPLSIRYKTGAWSYRVAMPYQYIEESANSILIGGDILPNANGEKVVSGFGDVTVSARYALNTLENSNTDIDLIGKIKFGTANVAKGLGSGSNDYTLELSVYQPTADQIDLFGSVGYRIKGDLPQQALNNVWLGSAGFTFPLSSASQFGISYDYRQATFARGSAIREISPYVDWKYDQDVTLNTYALIGLSRASPDFGIGMQISYSY